MIKNVKEKYQFEIILFLILIIAFVVIGFGRPDRFFTIMNLKNMAFQMPELGILSLAMMATILTGGINLSIISSATLSSIIGAYVLSSPYAKQHPIPIILLTIAIIIIIALILGSINGFLIAYVGAAAMLVTLGTMTLFEGIGLNLTKGGTISGFPKEFIVIGNKALLGIPIPIFIYVIICIISYLILERLAFGIKVHMLGSNSIASEFSGINVKKIIFKVYLYSSVMSAIAGMIMISRYNSAKIDYGSSYLMQSITAVVLGGTSIYGGKGSVLGTVIAACIIQIVSTGLNIIGINRNIVDIVIGVILVAVLIIRFLVQHITKKKMEIN